MSPQKEGGGVGTKVHSKVKVFRCLQVQWKFDKETNISSVKEDDKRLNVFALTLGEK